MKRVAFSFLALALLFAFSVRAVASDATPGVSADEALRLLIQGNERFAANKTAHPHSNFDRLVDTAEHGQHPFATVLGCSDSRVPVELLFDQGFGDIFVVRVAGGVCADDETGSIEYGVSHLGTPILVVLGHTQCGAVTATVEHEHADGHIKSLVSHIEPAVKRVRAAHPELSGAALIEKAVVENVYVAIEELFDHSPMVVDAVE
jgi:carbonic anhydrase